MSRDARPAWREPMTWLVAGLPLAVMVAAIVTIAMARRSPADASDGETRRIAQVQIDDLAPDRAAARLGLQGRLDVDAGAGALTLRFDPPVPHAERLELALLHPLDEHLDRRFALLRESDAWRGTTAPWPASQAWELRLRSPRGEWRLTGRLVAGTRSATLVPAVVR